MPASPLEELPRLKRLAENCVAFIALCKLTRNSDICPMCNLDLDMHHREHGHLTELKDPRQSLYGWRPHAQWLQLAREAAAVAIGKLGHTSWIERISLLGPKRFGARHDRLREWLHTTGSCGDSI